jgi:tripartite-type tricarboxylate transporter receptor subunit TctC
VINLHAAGQIRMIAVNSPERIAAAPDIPTAREAGLSQMLSQTFFAVFAPANTPKTILDALNEPTQEALRDDDFRKNLTRSGYDPLPGFGPEEARTFIEAEYIRWQPIVQRVMPH